MKKEFLFKFVELDDFPCNQGFNKKIYDKRYKNGTCDVYEKIQLGWKTRKQRHLKLKIF